MKRSIVALVLTGLALSVNVAGTSEGDAVIGPPDPIGIINSILTPPRRIVIGGWYRPVPATKQFLILCEASAFGGFAVYTQITSCTVTSSNGGAVRGLTPAIYAGFEAISPGAGALELGTYTACVGAKARYLDGTIISVSGCQPAKFLQQGYI